MDITVNNQTHKVNQSAAFYGGEADVYVLGTECLKWFNEDALKGGTKAEKVLALCDKSDEISLLPGFKNLAIPLHPAYENDILGGYTMHFFKNYKTITEYEYDTLDDEYRIKTMDNTLAVSLMGQLFRTLQMIHQAKIILGDLNSENILLNEKTSELAIVDFDSAHIGNFPCEVGKKEYQCPIIRKMGKNADDSWSYSATSDIYSLSIICFELLVGIHPFKPTIEPYLKVEEAMAKDINYMNFHHNKKKEDQGYSLVNPGIYKTVLKRIDFIEKTYPQVYKHFLNVFHFNIRDYYNTTVISKIKTPRRNKIQQRRIRPIRGYTAVNERKDPRELGQFLKQYQLNLTL